MFYILNPRIGQDLLNKICFTIFYLNSYSNEFLNQTELFELLKQFENKRKD
jgi:hypothetical protein